MRIVPAFLLGLLVAGCARPEKVGGTPEGVWVKEPLISVGSPDAIAEEHCARYGKTAVPAAKMVGDQGDWRQPADRSQHMPIYAYDCK